MFNPLVMIEKWKRLLGIEEWVVSTFNIEDQSICYNGEGYFIGIVTDHLTKTATIYHDIDLDEEAVVHELLHIVFPEPNEDETHQDYEKWITEAAINLSKNEY